MHTAKIFAPDDEFPKSKTIKGSFGLICLCWMTGMKYEWISMFAEPISYSSMEMKIWLYGWILYKNLE